MQLVQWGRHLCWGLDATTYYQATAPWTIMAASIAQKTSCCICYSCCRELLQDTTLLYLWFQVQGIFIASGSCGKVKKKISFSFCSERHALIASKFIGWGIPKWRHEFRYWTAKKEWQMSTVLTLDKSLGASLFYNTREITFTWLRRWCRCTYSFYNKYQLCARMQRCAGPF